MIKATGNSIEEPSCKITDWTLQLNLLLAEVSKLEELSGSAEVNWSKQSFCPILRISS
jgi:hypothetical protein